MYDFSKVIDRRGTGSIKWDVSEPFGTTEALTPFWIADMDFPTPPEVQEALHARVDHPIFGYSIPPEGAVEALCGWYARRHGFHFAPDEVICGIGVITMMSCMFDVLTAPGDEIVVMSPVYDTFYHVIENTGRKIRDVPLKEDNGFHTLDLAGLEEALRDGVKLVLFCNPHNPIGRVWTREELTDLVTLCVKYNAVIISDEVHGDIELNGNRYCPMGTVPGAGDRTITCTAISKSFNLAGLHQSCIIIQNPDLLRKIDDRLRSVWIMGPNVLAYHAMKAAYTYADGWLDELNEYIAGNARYVCETMAEKAPEILAPVPEGGFLMWLDLRRLGKSSSEISAWLVEHYKVAVSSGANYGPKADGYLRLNIGCPRVTLKKAVESLVAFAEAFRPSRRPEATLTMEDGSQIRMELYPELAPNTVNSFISLAKKGCFDHHAIERIEPGYVVDVSFTGFGREDARYLIANEAPCAGGINPLPCAPGYVAMGGYPDGIAGGEFFFPLASSDRTSGKYPVFGKILEGADLVQSWGELPLKPAFYPSVPPCPTFQPASPLVIASVTVETFGQVFPEPVPCEMKELPAGWR